MGTSPQRRRRGIRSRALDALGSVWFGVVLASLLFVYCSIGSGFPYIRQLPALEMTEFEWFHWWPFNVLIVLLSLSLSTATVRRIPFRVVNVGVWMIHAGIIILVIGSYYYFGTKVEGDVPVFRRQIVINAPGLSEPARLLAVPGSRTQVDFGRGTWQFQVQSTNRSWPILSDEHAGRTAYAVNVAVTPPNDTPFVRQLLAGYPQYTEDVIPGRGRAIKELGRKLITEDVDLSLDYEPQTHFFVMDTWALYVRDLGDYEWSERPIQGLPRYNDHVASRDQVSTDPAFPIKLRALDVPVPPAAEGDALAGARVRITGYLRYAQMRRSWRPGGQRLNPILGVTLLSRGREATPFELAALDHNSSVAADGSVQFIWLADSADVADLPKRSQARLTISVPAGGVALEVPLTRDRVVGSDGAYTSIEGTDFAYRVISLTDRLPIQNSARSVSVAMVGIRTADGAEFTRMVSDDPRFIKDIHGNASDPHTGREAQLPDERIEMRYRPATAPILFAGHPGGLYFVFNSGDTHREEPVRAGDVLPVTPDLSVRVDRMYSHAVAENKPFVVPPPARQRNAGETFSWIRLEVQDAGNLQTQWIPFNRYGFSDAQYAYSGRMAYQPRQFRLEDGNIVEVLFSRQRRRLPAPIALEAFSLDAHFGGYTGSVASIRNYVSLLRFYEPSRGAWTPPRAIAVNHPTEYGGYSYFQSMWDKPPPNDPAGGMNYTGLGVGNRNGVVIQLVGCCLSTAGMMFAFYVKPMLKHRRMVRQRAKAGRRSHSQSTSEGAKANAFDSQDPLPAVHGLEKT